MCDFCENISCIVTPRNHPMLISFEILYHFLQTHTFFLIYWDYTVHILWSLALWPSGLSLCLWHWDPIWVPVQVLAAPLPLQLSAMAQESKYLGPDIRLGDPGRISWLLALDQPSSGCYSHLGSEPVDGRPFPLFLLCFLK